jgi:hypothetical protein
MYVSTHTDKDGNVLAVYDDGDLGVYKNEDKTTTAEVDAAHSKGNTSAGGQKMGETAHAYSFANFDKIGKKGNIAASNGFIDYNSTWAGDKIKERFSQVKGIVDYFKNAGNGGVYDIKTNDDNPMGAEEGAYYGSILTPNGTIVSARDAGNILAGMVAKNSNISTRELLNGFGAYQMGGNNKIWAGIISAANYSYAPFTMGLVTPQDLFKNRGEDTGSYKAIKYGVNNFNDLKRQLKID